MSELSIADGKTDGWGGGILNQGNLTLIQVRIGGCEAFSGGGIYNSEGAILSGDSVELSGNTASFIGGGAYSGTEFYLSGDSLVVYNTAESGGGLYNSKAGIMEVSDTRIAYNEAIEGGGVFNDGEFTMIRGRLDFNSADSGGGFAGKSTSQEATFSNVTVVHNVATVGDGGGFAVFMGTLNLSGCYVSQNSSVTGVGEGIWHDVVLSVYNDLGGNTINDKIN